MVKFKNLLVGFQLLFIFSLTYAQQAKVSAGIDTNDVLIGDQIKLKLEFTNTKKSNLIWAEIPDSIGKIEFVKKGKIDTLIKKNLFQLNAIYNVTSFDSGYYSLPSFSFTVNDKGMTPETLFTEPLELRFTTLEVDTTKAFKDIKGPLDVPIDWKGVFYYILIGLVILAGFYFTYRYWQKKKKVKDVELDYDPKIPPYILALEALKQLEAEKLWQSGYVKKYYVRMTDIIRIYMRRQFGIHAMEMITSEIIYSLEKAGIKSGLISEMKTLFETADLSKFAKYQPMPEDNAKCMSYSINFVNSTKPSEIEKEHKQEHNESVGDAK